MTIKIDQGDPNLIRSTNSGQSSANNGATNSTDPGNANRTAPRETLELTAGARDAAEIARTLAAEPAFDSARVESIRQAVTRGDYPVDAERLADAILRLESELPGSDNEG